MVSKFNTNFPIVDNIYYIENNYQLEDIQDRHKIVCILEDDIFWGNIVPIENDENKKNIYKIFKYYDIHNMIQKINKEFHKYDFAFCVKMNPEASLPKIISPVFNMDKNVEVGITDKIDLIPKYTDSEFSLYFKDKQVMPTLNFSENNSILIEMLNDEKKFVTINDLYYNIEDLRDEISNDLENIKYFNGLTAFGFLLLLFYINNFL